MINLIKSITLLLVQVIAFILVLLLCSGISDYAIHKDEARKQRYISRHKNNENFGKSGADTAGWWSFHNLCSYPTKEGSYKNIKEDLKKLGYI